MANLPKFNLFDFGNANQAFWPASLSSTISNAQAWPRAVSQPSYKPVWILSTKPVEQEFIKWVNPKVTPQQLKQTEQLNKPQQSPNYFDNIVPKVHAWNEPTDEELKQLIDEWYTDEQIMSLYETWGTQPIQQMPIQQIPTQEQPKQWWFTDWVWEAWQQALNVAGWAISEVPKIAWNLAWEALWFAEEYNPASLIRKVFWQWEEISKMAKSDKESLQELGQWMKSFIQTYWPYNPESTGAKVWEVWTQIWATLIWPWKVFTTAREANLAVKALAWLANASIDWTIWAVTYYGATEWRLPTADEVKNFIAISWATSVLSKTAWAIKSIPVSKVVAPTWKDIARWLKTWEAIADTWISLTKWSLIKKIEWKISSLSNKIDEHIDAVMKVKWPANTTMDDITAWLKEKMLSDPAVKKSLQWTPIDAKDISDSIDETLSAYKDLYKGQTLDLAAQQQLKKDIYNWLQNVYKKADTAKLTARQVTEKWIAKTLKERVEQEVPEVADLNRQLAPYLEANKRLKAKWEYSQYLTDLIAWGYASWNPSEIVNDPVWYANKFFTWVLVKRLWTSTAAKTTIATLLNKTEKLFQNKAFQRLLQEQYSKINQQ